MAHRRTEPSVNPGDQPSWRPFDVEGRRAELQKDYEIVLSTVLARARQASAVSPETHVVRNAEHDKVSTHHMQGIESTTTYQESKDLNVAPSTAPDGHGTARKAGFLQGSRQGPIGKREIHSQNADANAELLWTTRMLALCKVLVEDELPEALEDSRVVRHLECVRQAAKEALSVAGDVDAPTNMDVDG